MPEHSCGTSASECVWSSWMVMIIGCAASFSIRVADTLYRLVTTEPFAAGIYATNDVLRPLMHTSTFVHQLVSIAAELLKLWPHAANALHAQLFTATLSLLYFRRFPPESSVCDLRQRRSNHQSVRMSLSLTLYKNKKKSSLTQPRKLQMENRWKRFFFLNLGSKKEWLSSIWKQK